MNVLFNVELILCPIRYRIYFTFVVFITLLSLYLLSCFPYIYYPSFITFITLLSLHLLSYFS